MARRWWTAAAAAAALALPSLPGCNALRKTTECSVNLDCPRGTSCVVDSGYCRTGGPILVGFLADRPGPEADVTEERRVALEFGRWIIEQDPARKVLGRGLDFHIEDTTGTLSEIPAATTRVLDANVAALIGPGPSAEVLEAQKQTFARRVLQLAPSGGAPSLGDAQPQDVHQRFLFQMVIGVTDFVPTVPLFLASPVHPPAYDACLDGMALVTSDDTLGVSLQAALKASLEKDCIPVTQVLTVPATAKPSYADEVNALLGAAHNGTPTRCVFLGVQTDVAGDLLRTLNATPPAGRYSAFIGGGTLNDVTFFDDAKSPIAGAPSLADGFYGIDADANPDRVELRDLEDLWAQYLKTQSVLALDTPIGTNRVSYAEAVIALALAIELAGSVDDPVALRDAFLDVTGHSDGDQIFGPKDVAQAFAQIRAARADGRRAAIDYNASYSNLEFDNHGFVSTGTMVWHAHDRKIDRVIGFSEDQVAAAIAAKAGPACPKTPP